MRVSLVGLVAGVLALASFHSCSSATDGIFATIESEQKIVSNGNLSDTATVGHMVRFNSNYYVSSGRLLYSRSVSDSNSWTGSTIDGSDEVQAVGTTDAGGKLWAVAGNALYSSTDGSTWTSVSLANSKDEPIDLVPIMSADGYSVYGLLVVTRDTSNNDSYSRVYYIDASDSLQSTATALTGLTEASNSSTKTGTFISSEVTAAVYDGSSTFFFCNESYLFSTTDFTSTTKLLSISSGPETGYQGLLYLSSKSKLYMTTLSVDTTGGGIYYANDITGADPDSITWKTIKSDAQSSSSYPVWFGNMIYNPAIGVIWIGTGYGTATYGNGFAQLTTSGTYSLIPTTTSLNSVSTYTSSDLYDAPVPTFFVDTSASNNAFIGTVAYGLWKWTSSTKALSQQ